ncbi:hypothetical protein E3N88_20568 [Mikania micrantha]|uniref:Uncharacterized protein n=1 Tax=Mikania micrantha TaxID=192012 RepID=A0A5N6NJY3_9ASTR|nr:hypothetical protein E3N88_20568 [Mikania micrantha]
MLMIFKASDNLLHLMLRKGSKVLSDFSYSLCQRINLESLCLCLWCKRRFLGSFKSSEAFKSSKALIPLSVILPKQLSCITFGRNKLSFGSNAASEESLLPSEGF